MEKHRCGAARRYINIIPLLDSIAAEGDEKTGVRIIKRALEDPLRTIATTRA